MEINCSSALSGSGKPFSLSTSISIVNNLIQHIKTIGISKTLDKILSKLKGQKGGSEHSKQPPWGIKMKHMTKNLKHKLFIAKKSSSGEIYHHDC